MAGFGFQKNTVFEWNGARFLIKELQPNGDVWLERQSDGQLSVVPKSSLLVEYKKGAITASDTRGEDAPQHCQPEFGRPLDELPEKVRQELERRKHYLSFITGRGRPTFTCTYMKPLIAEAAESIKDSSPPSVTTVYRWLRAYKTSNDPRSLIPRHDLRGAKGSKQEDRLLQLLAEAVEEAYKASPQASGATIYTRLLGKIEKENRCSLEGARLNPPSDRTVYRMLKNASAYEMSLLKNGKRKTERMFSISKNGVQTTQILERVEMDHTPLDLFLVDEKTNLPLGRPTLTVVIDHFSRMLLGYYLSYGSPSAGAVMGALRHAILPKDVAEAVIPNLKTENLWPCYGIPDLIVVDNGLEFHGHAFESVAFDLGIRIQYCPKHKPQFKGVVERFLKTINYSFCHQLPGTSFARFHQRGDYDPQQHALLTLSEFKQIFEKWVVDVYAQTVHRGIGTTPWEKWHQGLDKRPIKLPPSRQDLKKKIGLVTERSLRRDGINFPRIRYNSDALAPILRRYGEGVRVRVLYDPEDLGEILVWPPEEQEPICVPALDQGYAKNLTVQQDKAIGQIMREQGAKAGDKAAQQRAHIALIDMVDEQSTSRKQRNRRRAGALRGMSSNNPKLDLKPGKRAPASRPLRKSKKHNSDTKKKTATEIPSLLPTFQLRKTGGVR